MVPWLLSQTTPEDEVQFFRLTPWTGKIVENSLFRAVPCPSHLITTGTSHNAFIAKIINKPSFVSHWLMMICRDFVAPQEAPHVGTSQSKFLPDTVTYDIDLSEIITLLKLGKDLDGFPGRAQGGVLCAILGEALSLCVECH